MNSDRFEVLKDECYDLQGQTPFLILILILILILTLTLTLT